MQLTKEELEYIIDHVFLPLKLPQEYDVDSVHKDAILARFIAKTAMSFCMELRSEITPLQMGTWKVATRMLENVARLHEYRHLDKRAVERALKGMQLNDVLSLYIAAQNAVVIFRKVRHDRLTYEHFEASLPAAEVMKKCNKIQMQFPSNPRLLVESKEDVLSTLANLLEYFSQHEMDDALPKSNKGGSEHHETRDTTSPRYISEAIAGLIRATQPPHERPVDTPYIIKRLDDHVLWKSAAKPWRRSPLWLLLRVSLQTTLHEGGLSGPHGYKAFQAFFMASILKNVVDTRPNEFTNDLLHFANAKIARRLAKMGELVEDERNKSLRTAGNTVQEISDFLKQRWDQITTQWEGRSQWTSMEPEMFNDSLKITFRKSQAYLRRMVDRKLQNEDSFDKEAFEEQLMSTCAKRATYDAHLLPVEIPQEDPDIALFDFESWVQKHLQNWVSSPLRSEEDCTPLYKITHIYWKMASSHYKDNPERLSLMYLCILELWVAIDRFVTRWCMLLLEYSPEIPVGFLDPLLLPYFEQVKRLHQVQKYLHERHDRASLYGRKSVFQDPNTPGSFANRFFNLSLLGSSLRELQDEIQTQTSQWKSDKLGELERLNSRYQGWKKQAETHQHLRERRVNKEGNSYEAHLWRSCQKCYYERRMSESKIAVLEEPLPKDSTKAHAVIFELACPQPFAIWRDLTATIIQGSDEQCQEQNVEAYLMSEYEPLCKFYRPTNTDIRRRIKLASSKKSIAASHYKEESLPTMPEFVIEENAGQFSLYDSRTHTWVTEMAPVNLGEQCIFLLNDSYTNLQSYLNTTSHLPNQIIAKQDDCPDDMSIDEYLTFGHLRSGVRLQWRNILRAIRTHSLTFSEPSVYFLILQAIWQAGPIDEEIDENVYREAHAELDDAEFCVQAIRELNAFCKLIGNNWTQTLPLMTVISLALRIHNFTSSVVIRHRASIFLQKARSIALEWISLILEADETRSHRDSLIGASFALRATFDVETETHQVVLQTDEDAIQYLYAGTFISNLIINSLPLSIRWLAQRDRLISLRLQCSIYSLCNKEPSILHKVASRREPEYEQGQDWCTLLEPAEMWWTTTSSREENHRARVFHFNIIDGSFFTDGKLSDRLPNDYTSHQTYISLFGSRDIGHATLSKMEGMDYRCQYQGQTFHLSLRKPELIIRRYQGNRVEEFIPPDILQWDLPQALICHHEHWYIIGSNSFEARPSTRTPTTNRSKVWRATLDIRHRISGTVTATIDTRESRLLDPYSPPYIHLRKFFTPLEPQPYGVVVTIEDGDSLETPSIYLPRHGLSFRVSESRQLESPSFPGFVVDLDYRGIGCLIGLRTLVSIRNDSFQPPKRKVIIPKGEIISSFGLYGHPCTSLSVGDATGYFVYEVDDILGRLHGSRTVESDLFLAQLHAFTSSSLPDDLTGRPGTNEALEILNGPSCFSAHSLSIEAKSFLHTLASLTPSRQFYPPHLQVMETIVWHSTLPPLSQHPSFHPLVDLVINHWQEMARFIVSPHTKEESVKETEPTNQQIAMNHLATRARARHWIFEPHTSLWLSDSRYQPRECVRDSQSQRRENLAFKVAQLLRPEESTFPVCRSLRKTVLGWEKIEALKGWGWKDVNKWLENATNVGDLWCTLYELCRKVQWPPKFDVIAAFSLLGYCGVPLDVLATLMAVACHPYSFSSLPNFQDLQCLDLSASSTFNEKILEQVIRKHALEYQPSKKPEVDLQREQNYKNRLREDVAGAIEQLQSQWPVIPKSPKSLIIAERSSLKKSDFWRSDVHSLLLNWSINRVFLQSIDDSIRALETFYTDPIIYEHYVLSPVPFPHRSSPFRISSLVERINSTALPSSPLELLLTDLRPSTPSDFEGYYLDYLRRSADALATVRLPDDLGQDCRVELECLKSIIYPKTFVNKLMGSTGLIPVITPLSLLRMLSLVNRRRIPKPWVSRLIEYAVKIHAAKREVKWFQINGSAHAPNVSSEAQRQRPWDPIEHPDWLLIEIDADFSIRAEQVAMALEMINRPDGRNSVMQLNMGEGKSSVIVPIVSVSAIDISNAPGTLSRVIVPYSQLRQQFNILRRTLTSLCNRRIYYLPFTRKMKLNAAWTIKLRKSLEVAASTGATWLCEPEHLLSLKLLSLDMCLRDPPVGESMVNTLLWLHQNTCDVLDECDEVLHTKQQVIYTMGDQTDFDGAPWRWEFFQRLLGFLSDYLRQLEVVKRWQTEFVMRNSKERGAFPASLYFKNENCAQLVTDFITQTIKKDQWFIQPSLRHLSLEFVTSDQFPEDAYRKLELHCSTPQSSTLQTLFLLRGVLQSKMLLHLLKDKRYRVDYGLDKRRTLLAVPFRAKDLPSQRSQFGHSDVTILLTCLSYYYEGLDMDMVKQTLKRLLKSATPDLTYESWLEPFQSELPEQFLKLQGINWEDEKEVERTLLPFLQFNKLVIDSYLNWVVFPKEAKEFPSKISSSGWDLAIVKPHPTTGFSGTNDGRFLLPTSMTQLDRPAQLHTNAKVLSCLLQKENQGVHSYSSNAGSSALLSKLLSLDPKPVVVLDVGAQILDKSNREFAQEWLGHYKDDQKIKAVVFFEEEELMILTFDGLKFSFMDSPYSERPDQCLVYLDDAHTRGTDLRLPNVQALVTLGPRVTKDKLVQGCMRMRKLGNGQSVVFLGPDEVIQHIAKVANCSPNKITSREVLTWSIKETWKQLQANVPAYVVQGHSFARRETYWDEYIKGNISSQQLVEDIVGSSRVDLQACKLEYSIVSPK